jgi:hypothetical protein
MEAGKVIYDILHNNAGVSALTTSIYGNEAKQGIDFPCIVYSVISVNPINSKSGFRALQSRVQCSCFAESYKDSIELSIAVRNALADKPAGTYGGIAVQNIKFESSQDFTDNAGNDGAFHNELDFMVFYTL